jgi:hypothetical protein
VLDDVQPKVKIKCHLFKIFLFSFSQATKEEAGDSSGRGGVLRSHEIYQVLAETVA